MRTPSRPVAALCIALVALAGFLPGISWLDAAWFEPAWVLLPDNRVVACGSPVVAPGEQPLPLLARPGSRGPPSTPLA